MVGRNRKRPGVSPVSLALSISLGLCVTGLGAYQLYQLDQTQLRNEILYPVTPKTLQAWLVTLDPEDAATASRIAQRLLNMTLSQRRDAVLMMKQPAFFRQLSTDYSRQRGFKAMVLKGVTDALVHAPALSDLWYLAASLRNNLLGFDQQVQRYLDLSFTYGPKEVDLVVARLEMMSLAWSLLNDRSREIVRRDVQIVDQAYPARAGELRQYLLKDGAKLDD